MADTGRSFLIKKAGTAIAGARENGVSVDNSPINITGKGDSGFRTLASFAGEKALDISVSGVWTDKIMRDTALGADNMLTDVTIDFADGGDISCDFYLANYEETGVHNDAVTFTCSMQSSKAWTYTTAV